MITGINDNAAEMDFIAIRKKYKNPPFLSQKVFIYDGSFD